MKKYFCLSSFLNFINRNRLFTSITVFGFSISLMFALILGLYVYNELNVDKERENYDRVYQLRDNDRGVFSYLLGDQLLGSVPEIEHIVRVISSNNTFKTSNEEDAFKALMFYADTTIFSVLSFNIVEGSKQKPIPDLNSISVSRKFADKWFGEQPAVGKVLLWNIIGDDKYQPYTITSVFEDVSNSGFSNVDILISIENYGTLQLVRSFATSHNSRAVQIFVLERIGSDLNKRLENDPNLVPDYVALMNEWRAKDDVAEEYKFSIQKLGESYFSGDTTFGRSSVRSSNSIAIISILLSISMLLLVFSVINYINLSVAQIGFRSKEFAIRRLLGGTKLEVFMNFMIESFVLCGISFGIALLLSNVSLPVFNAIMHSDISLNRLTDVSSIAFVAGVIVVISLISGMFPAYRILAFKAIDVTKGGGRSSKLSFSKVLMAIQFFIASVLLSGTIIMFNQLILLQSGELGFKHKNIYQVGVSSLNRVAVSDALNGIAGVEKVGRASGLPIVGFSRNGTDINELKDIYIFACMDWNHATFDIFDVEILEVFDDSDADGIWFDKYTWDNMPISKSDRKVNMYGKEQNIKGIVNNFKFYDVTKDRNLLYLKQTKEMERYYSLVIELSDGDIENTLIEIRDVYFKITNGDILNMTSIDEAIKLFYRKQNQTATIIGYMSIASIVLSVMGIFAMSLYFIRQRKKEIAVRKIFGSTVSEITMKLFKSSVIIVAISFVASIPVTCYFMSDWLAQFSYNVGLQWYYFLAAAAILFVFSILSVLWHTLKAATDNPIKTINDR